MCSKVWVRQRFIKAQRIPWETSLAEPSGAVEDVAEEAAAEIIEEVASHPGQVSIRAAAGLALCEDLYGNTGTQSDPGNLVECLALVEAEKIRALAAGEEFDVDNVPLIPANMWPQQ